MSKALVIGRFQPFHIGHITLIEYCKQNYDSVVVGIGKDKSGRTERNPLTVKERKRIINTMYSNLKFISIEEDFEGGFVDNVKSRLPENTNPTDYILVTKNQTTIESLKSDFIYDIPDIPISVRATQIRKNILKEEKWTKYITKAIYDELKSLNFEEKVKLYS